MWFPFGRRKQSAEVKKAGYAPTVEALEDRCLLSGNSISGYVFHDLNGDGVRNPGEAAIANVSLELRNAKGQVVAQTTSDSKGWYQFDRDETTNRLPQTLTRTYNFIESPTDFTSQGSLQKFNPDLGELESVDLLFSGYIKSKIWAENLSSASAAQVTGTVMGSLTLGGGGLSAQVDTTPVNQKFTASKYDGLLDYGGSSGTYFGEKTANGTTTITLGESDLRLQNFLGNGSVDLTLQGTAHSTATGGGNLSTQFDSVGGGTVTVTYHYLLDDSLQPGKYTIHQTTPNGYLDGKESTGAITLPGTIGTDVITVVLNGQDSTDNNFGEVLPAKLCGIAYVDGNNNGDFSSDEEGLSGIVIVLMGNDDRGQTIKLQQTTSIDGTYCFNDLRPGTYTVKQLPPAGLLPGAINAAGTLGGQAITNCFSNVQLTSGAVGAQYDFGWLKPASLSGYVYNDANQNGVKDPGERGLGNMRVILTGFDDLGNQIRVVKRTNAAGFYQFVGLRPGEYSLTQDTRPVGFQHGENSLGSLGGGHAPQAIQQIFVGVGAFGQEYNFGKIKNQGRGCGRGGGL